MSTVPAEAPIRRAWRERLASGWAAARARIEQARPSAFVALVVALTVELLAPALLWVAVPVTVLQAVAAVSLLRDLRARRFGLDVARAPWRRVSLNVAAAATLVLFLSARLAVLHGWWAAVIDAAEAERILRSYGAVLAGAASVLTLVRGAASADLLAGLHLRPVQTVVLSFGVAVLGGTLLLSLPFALRSTADVSVADALFMATSAVCVTGLSVVDVATHYSAFGQVVLLLLVQAGGLGMMSLYAAFAAIGARQLSARSEAELANAAGLAPRQDLRRSLTFILAATLVVEAAGALLLWGPMRERHGDAAGAWYAVFHAVTAFCNAGFSNLPGGLAPYAQSGWTLAVVGSLVTVGGLGYPVLAELASARGRPRRPSLHLRLVVVTSAVLVAAGALGLLVLEWSSSLSPLGAADRVTNAVFLSVVARSAGFDVLDASGLSTAGAALMSGLMLVGASPASTGGGLKTTTVAVLALTLHAVLRRQHEVTVGRRTLATEDVLRAFAVVVAGVLLLGAGTLLLLVLESGEPHRVMFEAASAFSTAGLSMGLTGELSGPGRLVVVLLMFVGRVGPLTLLSAFLERREPGRFRYPRARVMFG